MVAEGSSIASAPDRRSRRRRRLAIALCLLLALLALALFLEAGARWKFRRVAVANPYVLRELAHTPEFSEAFSDDLWLEKWFAYEPGKSLEAESAGQVFRVSINSRGFRSPEVLVPKPPGKFRIVCIGGSTTVEGFTNESTYPALLEKELNERYGTDRFEVVNGGISGMRAKDELRKLPAYLELEPDLLLEYNAVNDLCWGILSDLENKAPWWRWWFWNSTFLRFHLDRPFQPSSEEMARLCRKTIVPRLRELSAQAREQGVDVAFLSFLHPDPSVLDGDERDFFEQDLLERWGRWSASLASYSRLVDAYNQELQQLCAEVGAGFLDLRPGFAGGAQEFQDVCHLTPQGIERKAEFVLARLCAYLEERHRDDLPFLR